MPKIEWTDVTWNPVTGCTKVSPGCKNCYAESMAKRFWGHREFSDVRMHRERLRVPNKLKKPQKIFVCSMSDLFHEDIPSIFISKVFNQIEYNPQHWFQILTKRAERLQRFMFMNHPKALGNLWLGVSVEDQKTADERIPLLLQTPAAVRFLSIEPMLERIDLIDMLLHEPWPEEEIDWIIIGCESGLKKRECKIEWVRNIVDQCRSVGFEKIFIKQLNINGKVVKDIEQFPEDLRIREYPKV